MATKYIVNNVSGQTLTGDLTINGNLNTTSVNNGRTYRALLTQTGSISGTSNDFNNRLIIGETYEITDYATYDDFSNVANVLSGGTFIDFDYVWTNPGYAYFNGLTGTTSGLGSGASFDVYICGTTYNSITVVTSGVDYVVGDTITILGTELSGSTPENNITITVTDLTPTETGCVFIATGDVPSYWGEGSQLVSGGDIVSRVLENSLWFDIDWATDFMSPGFYLGFNKTTGPLYNTFNRNSTFIQGGNQIPFFGPFLLDTFILPFNYNEKDDGILIGVFDLSGPTPVSDSLYYFPIEIQIKQDTDTTPIVINGTVVDVFPINYTSIDLRCNGNYIQTLYGDGTVNDMSELITYLNSEPNMSYLGTYSDAGDGTVNLEMPTNLVNQFCSNGTLTFEIFND